jgi:sugar (pentulose or hexulose) kinase
VLDQVTGETSTKRCDIFATGGGSRNDHWLQLRADVTGRTVHRPACPESAFGSAILAAAGAGLGDLWQVIRQMVRIEKTMVPDLSRKDRYDIYYENFKSLLRAKGYLRNSAAPAGKNSL